MAEGGWQEIFGPRLLPRTALVLLGVWLNAADGLVTATIMPQVARDLGGWAWFGWAVAIYLLGSILASASAGQLAARLGLSRAIVVTAVIYAAGCTASAAAPGLAPFLVGRLAQGLGGGWVAGFCYVAISRMFDERLWARLFAAGAGVWGVATFAGPLVGGAFAGAGFWRGAFWMFAIQGLALAVAAPALLKGDQARDDEKRPPLAWRTLVVLSLAILAIAIADIVTNAGAAVGLLLLGLALLPVAGVINARPGERLLPPEVMRPATAAGAGYAMIFTMIGASTVFGVYGAAFLQTLCGLSPLAAGYVVASDSLGWVLAAFLVANQPDRRHGPLIVAGAVVINFGMVLLAFTIGLGNAVAVFAAGFIFGAGFGLCWSLTNRRVLASLPEDERAIGASASPTAQSVGSAAGAAAAGAIANLLGLAHSFSPALAAAEAPWLFAAFIPLTGLGLLAAMRVARSSASPAG
jgi:MFS family permease